MVVVQVALGIITLLLKVPLIFALMHQLFAIALWSVALKSVCIRGIYKKLT